MALLALTNDNLAFFKRSLRADLPAVGSSHLSEALAAALGSRTGITLATRMREDGAEMPSLATLDQAAFAARLADLGHRVATLPALDAIARSPDLPDRLWAVLKDGDRPALNTWHGECQRRGIPYVYVRTGRQHARVDWDWITVNPAFDGVACDDDESKLVDRLVGAIRANAASSPKAKFDASAFSGYVEGLLLGDAHAQADAIFALLHDALRQARRPVPA
ncbi:hypothetical protein FW320_00090 [Azospirillum sp. Vi22]|uniref:hypothetical protein n=1 Tax=Azospirillum baldaniorum TaxID=1064539 RepID=UPI00157A5138|nr:hypothetical protein [Azospirillum baldaniorum]NUB04596.1 hypothetical protein [Azospirillum baldaniorum]